MADLGRIPGRSDVHIQRGYPWRLSMKMQDGSSWVTAPELRFDSGQVWASTIAGDTATWDIPATRVDVARVQEKVDLVLGDVLWEEGVVRESAFSGYGGQSTALVLPASGGKQVLTTPLIKGDTPSIAGGPTTTLLPGSSATASLVALSSTQYRLDLGLPKGDKGDTGATGAPGGSDPATASHISSGTDTPAALTAWLNAQNTITLSDALIPLASLADTQRGTVRLGIASDSTGNDINDWPSVFFHRYRALIPDTALRHEYRRWNQTNEAHDITVWQEGTATSSSGGVVVNDTFTRTGQVSGSTPDTGPVWSGSTVWSANGTGATASDAGAISQDVGTRDATTTADIDLISTGTEALQSYRVHVGGPTSSLASSVWAGLSVSTVGAVTVTLWKTISGTSTQLATVDMTGVATANSGTLQRIRVKVVINIQNVSATVTNIDTSATASATGTITEADYGILGNWTGVQSASTTTPGFVLNTFTAETPVVPGEPAQGIIAYNGAIGGGTLAYQQSRIANMYPDGLDVLVVSHGHNYGSDTPAQIITAFEAFLTEYQTVKGSLPRVVISSQNPEYSPASGMETHNRRQVALRAWAASKGYDYLGGYETFLAGGGASLVGTDGVHPTTPAVGDYTTKGTGSSAWADALMAKVATLRLT